MHHAKVLLTSLLLLTGCATPYDPNVQDIADPAQVAFDKQHCADLAKTYKRPLDAQGAAVAGGQGIAGNLATATAGIAGPLLGGAGGVLGAVFQWVGLIDVDTPRATQQCVRQRLDRDHAGILVEPPL